MATLHYLFLTTANMEGKIGMGNPMMIEVQTSALEAGTLAALEGVEVRRTEPLPAPPSDPLAEARFVDPVSVILVVSGAVLVKRLLDGWLKERERGVMIDVRKDPVLVSRIAGVPAGWVVIIDKDGNPHPHEAAYDNENLSDLLSSFLSAAKG